MSPELIAFYFFAGITVLSALFIAFAKNVLHAAFTLLATLLGVAALFVFARAEFLSIAQIMIYIGGILVLVIFGILITSSYDVVQKVVNRTFSITFFLFSMLVFAGLCYVISITDFKGVEQAEVQYPANEQYSQVNIFGINIMTSYLLPFEVSAVMLMAALLGAALIAGKNSNDDH